MQPSRVAVLGPDSLRHYLAESARPLAAMAFIAPLLLVYELGVATQGPHVLRNGADVWLRHWLDWLGFGQYFLLPVLTCGILLGWHYTRRDGWSLHGRIFPLMVLESLMLAMGLFLVAQLQRAMFASLSDVACATPAESAPGAIGRLVGYCGAGIYEELLFRLIMLPVVARVLRGLGAADRPSWAWAIVGTSLFFSAAHYQFFTAGGYHFDWYSFLFRLTAGMFFALLFVFRGFGIAAAAHALYDVLVEIL